jgi:L-lactate dehydrogenase (cytochrome)
MCLRDRYAFHDFRALARRRLPIAIFDCIDGAVAVTHRQNTASCERCELVPNFLRGVKVVDILVTVLGHKLAAAFYCFPTALRHLFHHQGERCGSCGREVRHNVWRILARPGWSAGAAYDARYTASLSGLFPQRSRTQPCHAATRQGGWRRGHDADGGQHHWRPSATRSAGRFFIPSRLVPGMLKFAIKPMRCINCVTYESFKRRQLDDHVDMSGGTVSCKAVAANTREVPRTLKRL